MFSKTSQTTFNVGVLAFMLGFIFVWMTPARSAPLPIVPKDVIYAPVWSRAACGDTCTVTFSPGGELRHYMRQVESIKADGILLRIDGPCASACTMAADKARPNVCVTPRASFLFHNGTETTARTVGEIIVITEKRFDPSSFYSADINLWVRRHGGYPGRDTTQAEMNKFLTMPFRALTGYFPVCD